MKIIRASPVYETEAHVLDSETDSGPFLNMVAQIETSLNVMELLNACQEVENREGRDRRSGKWKPRTLDIDVLLYGGLYLESSELTIPHPRMLDRLFVLRPLTDIAPDLRIPGRSRFTAADGLAACTDRHLVHRLYELGMDESEDEQTLRN